MGWHRQRITPDTGDAGDKVTITSKLVRELSRWCCERAAVPSFPPSDFHFAKFVQSIGGDKSPFPIQETQSPFRRRAQQTSSHRRVVRRQSRSFAQWKPQLQPVLLRI